MLMRNKTGSLCFPNFKIVKRSTLEIVSLPTSTSAIKRHPAGSGPLSQRGHPTLSVRAAPPLLL